MRCTGVSAVGSLLGKLPKLPRYSTQDILYIDKTPTPPMGDREWCG